MGASREKKKARILADVQEARSSILAAASELSEAQRGEVFLGVWSVSDILAHVAGWDLANIEGIEAILGGRLPDFYRHFDPGWRSFNAELVARNGRSNWDELTRWVQHCHQRLMARARQVPAEDFFIDRGLRWKGRRVTVDAILRADARDVRKHRQQIVDHFRGGTCAK